MRVLITGGLGQLGRSLQAALARRPQATVTIWELGDHDISTPAAADWVADLRPDVVINASAFTAVDAAEADEAGALAVNARGAAVLAAAAREAGAHRSSFYRQLRNRAMNITSSPSGSVALAR